MDIPRECHTEWTFKSGRGGEIAYDIHYMWNRKQNDTNELNLQSRLTDLDLMVDRAVGRGSVWDEHVHIATIKWITAKDRPYSTGNPAVLPGSLGARRALARMDTCLWVPESLPSSPELLQHCLLIGCTRIQNTKFKNNVWWSKAVTFENQGIFLWGLKRFLLPRMTNDLSLSAEAT